MQRHGLRELLHLPGHRPVLHRLPLLRRQRPVERWQPMREVQGHGQVHGQVRQVQRRGEVVMSEVQGHRAALLQGLRRPPQEWRPILEARAGAKARREDCRVRARGRRDAAKDVEGARRHRRHRRAGLECRQPAAPLAPAQVHTRPEAEPWSGSGRAAGLPRHAGAKRPFHRAERLRRREAGWPGLWRGRVLCKEPRRLHRLLPGRPLHARLPALPGPGG
mmetsp:Transcript_87413/g.270625  ORF Transcript_87413/g.270625 Transcript_87413/m.270625 type:complete len:220 (-) Transcript_87413:1441-2100(-)